MYIDIAVEDRQSALVLLILKMRVAVFLLPGGKLEAGDPTLQPEHITVLPDERSGDVLWITHRRRGEPNAGSRPNRLRLTIRRSIPNWRK